MLIRFSSNEITIHANHYKSLQLIHGYFEKYTSVKTLDIKQPPFVKFVFKGDHFLSRKACETLIIQPQDSKWQWVKISPILIMTFVESVLGYKQTWQDSNSWSYRRDRPFAS
jgi:hypothetical protein